MNSIPLLIPELPRAEEVLPYLVRIDANRQYTNFGPLNREFEGRLSDALSRADQSVSVLTVANCTLGLELALQAMGVERGDRVLVPALTFVATATAVIRAGGIPVFADVDIDCWSLTPDIARRAAKEHSLKAVIPVSTYGCPLDTDGWDEFVEETGISVVVDAAGAWGNQLVGRSFDVVYSFHATKSFGIGEGGAVASTNKTRLDRIKRLCNFGIDTSLGTVTEIGTNAKLSEYHCAVGLAALDRWETTRKERVMHMSDYLARLQMLCPGLIYQDKPRDGVYPLLTIGLQAGNCASEILRILSSEGIECRRWYCPPLYQHDALAGFPRMHDTSIADALGNRLLGLPYFISMSGAQIDRVAVTLNEIILKDNRSSAISAGVRAP
ncbi:MAG: aminotransferase class I/II-fold pyridoxal phosphate-dependent enzyme [Dokdonella sp.]